MRGPDTSHTRHLRPGNIDRKIVLLDDECEHLTEYGRAGLRILASARPEPFAYMDKCGHVPRLSKLPGSTHHHSMVNSDNDRVRFEVTRVNPDWLRCLSADRFDFILLPQ